MNAVYYWHDLSALALYGFANETSPLLAGRESAIDKTFTKIYNRPDY